LKNRGSSSSTGQAPWFCVCIINDYLRFFYLADTMFLNDSKTNIDTQDKINSIEQDDSLKVNFFELLPDEVLLYIYQFLDEKSFRSLSKTHKRSNDLSKDEFFKNTFLVEALYASIDLRKPLNKDLSDKQEEEATLIKNNNYQYYIKKMLAKQHPYFLILKSIGLMHNSKNNMLDAIKLCYATFKKVESKEDFLFLKQYVNQHFFYWNKFCFESGNKPLSNMLVELHE
jgi:hypothetical protein